jgi:hypothetical protein
MSTHKDRKGEIAFWAVPLKDSPYRSDFEKKMVAFGERPEVKSEINKIWAKAVALIEVQKLNGAGFYADKMIREYNFEYNSRVVNGSLHDLPGSFNIGEAFHHFLPPSATFKIRPENDNLFSFDDFVDYLTSDASDLSAHNVYDLTEEGRIYSYNSTSDPANLQFSTRTGKRYGFSSVSIIRFGSELSMILLAGRVCNLAEETEKILRKFAATEIFKHRAHIQADPNRVLRAEPLFEGSNLWKTVVLTRFDLDAKTIDVRYVYEDWGQSYSGISDDRDSFVDYSGNFINEKAKDAYANGKAKMIEYEAIFELCKTCLMLPKYFSEKDDEVVIERHPTDFAEFRKKLSNKKVMALVDSTHHISHRNLNVLRKAVGRTPSKSEFFAPSYKIETRGFWKKLTPQAIGRDKSGNPIQGRTWVSQTEAWVEEYDHNATVIAEKKPQAHRENEGIIYVMRSAAHQKNIFKVGLTRRDAETRAKELTRTTGSPDQFLVVQEWEVADCVLAEKLIHDELQHYRINPNREFFMADYRVIRAVVDSVIDKVESAAV